MNLRDLEYFIAVAEFQHFGHAAKSCYVSQPTLSGQIKKLEEELQVILFERSNRKVMLTEAGELILPYAQHTLASAHDITEVAETLTSPLSGRFHIAAIPTMASYLFPTLVLGVRKTLPDLTLILSEEKTDDLIEKLKKGELDAGILALPIEDSALSSESLFTDQFFLAVPPDHPFTSHETIDLDYLNNQQLLLLEEGHCLRGQALQACQSINLQEDNFMATSLETLRQMVKAGTGITIIPEMAIHKGEQDIRYLPLQSNNFNRTVGLVWRKTSVRTSVIQRIAKILK